MAAPSPPTPSRRRPRAAVRAALLGALLASGPLLQSGCAVLLLGGAAAAATAGTIAYVNGEIVTLESASIEKVWQASESAVEGLRLSRRSARHDGLTGELEARTADDTKVVVRLERKSDTTTELRVRVGLFGDEGRSRAILREIESRL